MKWKFAILGALVAFNALVWLNGRRRPHYDPDVPRRATVKTSTPGARNAAENARERPSKGYLTPRSDTRVEGTQTAEYRSEPSLPKEGVPVAQPSMPQFELIPEREAAWGSVNFKQSGVTKLKRTFVHTQSGDKIAYLDFVYYDPHPAYRREVHVRMPEYFAMERRTPKGWYARFRWWEVKPDWSDTERMARIRGVESGSGYVSQTTPNQYVPRWVLPPLPPSTEESVALLAGAEAGSQYVLNR